MKNKRLIKIIVILLIYFCYLSFCYKVNAEDDITSELLKSQSSTLGISSFIEEANKYKSEDFDIDVNELITSAIKGNVDNQTIGRKMTIITGLIFTHNIIGLSIGMLIADLEVGRVIAVFQHLFYEKMEEVRI